MSSQNYGLWENQPSTCTITNMDIQEVTEKEREAFNRVVEHPLQSWEWGEFRKAHGNIPIRFGVYKGKQIVSGIQLLLHRMPYTNFFIGSIIKGPAPTQETLAFLQKFAKQFNLLFIKFEPNIVPKDSEEALDMKVIFRKYGAKEGKRLFTPTTFWVDLTQTEDQLLKSFSAKTRYNIRVAQKHKVTVIEDNSEKAFDRYIELTRETVTRQGFWAHTEKYHRLMWKTLRVDMIASGQAPIAHLLTAKYNSEIITTWILFEWHDFLYYPYGASTYLYKNVMANNLMMWEAIRFGKSKKLKTFDLWGREEDKGFTKFKEGYNPRVVEFLGTWDMISSPAYYSYQVLDKLRWNFMRTKVKLGLSKPKF